MATVFDQIKKQNGETFAKAIRNYDNGILDIPGIVDIVRYAGREAEPIMNYLVSLKGIRIEEHGAYQDPITLLDKAGYDAYYADTLEKQNAIQKYYASAKDLKRMNLKVPVGPNGEWLCTFRDSERFKNYYIINAVRKDVDKIKREDFIGKEQREDEYGTSVLSIQIAKNGGFISIKNRYNHTVENPDNTLNSNPDYIILGLSQSLKNFFNVDFSAQKVCVPDGFTIINNQVVRYNDEYNNVYFGSDFYVKDGTIHEIDKNTEIMFDHYILNIKEKTLWNPAENKGPISINRDLKEEEDTDAFNNPQFDSFDSVVRHLNKRNKEDEFDVFAGEFKNKSITFTKNKDGSRNVCADGVPIVKVKDGQIVGLNLLTTKKIGDDFLSENNVLKEFNAPELKEVGISFLSGRNLLKKIELPKLKKTGDYFLCDNRVIKECFLPEIEITGSSFLRDNTELKKIDLPKLKEAGKKFLSRNEMLSEFNAPELESTSDGFFMDNNALKRINLPKLKRIGDHFFCKNQVLTDLCVPQVQEIGEFFLTYNRESLEKINLPNVKSIGKCFLNNNKTLKEFNAPELEEMGDFSLVYNKSFEKIELPKLKTVGSNFLANNFKIKECSLPQVEEIGSCFLRYNNSMEKIYLPNVKKIGEDFLCNNETIKECSLPQVEEIAGSFFEKAYSLEKIDLPNVKKIRDDFISGSRVLKEFNAPQLEEIGDSFLMYNRSLGKIDLPKVKKIGESFLYHNETLKEFSAPQVERIGNCFLEYSKSLEKVDLPNVKFIGSDFLRENETLTENDINIPKVEVIGGDFLFRNKCIKKINFPNVECAGNRFLALNKVLTECSMPQLKKLGFDFLRCNNSLEKLDLPNLEEIKSLDANTWHYTESHFMEESKALKEFIAPKLSDKSIEYLPENTKNILLSSRAKQETVLNEKQEQISQKVGLVDRLEEMQTSLKNPLKEAQSLEKIPDEKPKLKPSVISKIFKLFSRE